MSFTAAQVIESALKWSKIVPRSQPVPPNWLDEGRELLNVMLAEWRLKRLYFETQSVAADDLNVAIALDDDIKVAWAYNLAKKLCSAFGFDIPPDVAEKAPQMLNIMLSDAKGPLKSDIDPALQGTYRRGDSSCGFL